MKTYSGRLLCDGEGNLLADEGRHKGKPVAHVPEEGVYVLLEEGEPSHNERHGTGSAPLISGTSGPLYDAAGTLVYAGDPHHLEPTPDDPHYDASAPNKTRLTWDPDRPHLHKVKQVEVGTGQYEQRESEYDGEPYSVEIMELVPEEGDPTSTGHTEAYK